MISNPITILPRDREAARLAANVLPPPEPFVVDMMRVTRHPMVLNVEAVTGCTSLRLEPGVFGEDSFRARFALGVPPAGARDTITDPWGRCTLADRRNSDFRGYAGLRFEVRSDAAFRVTLAMADAEAVRATSFLTDTTWREIAIPFRQLADDFDLARISEVSFFFETSGVPSGTEREIEVRGISLVPDP